MIIAVRTIRFNIGLQKIFWNQKLLNDETNITMEKGASDNCLCIEVNLQKAFNLAVVVSYFTVKSHFIGNNKLSVMLTSKFAVCWPFKRVLYITYYNNVLDIFEMSTFTSSNSKSQRFIPNNPEKRYLRCSFSNDAYHSLLILVKRLIFGLSLKNSSPNRHNDVSDKKNKSWYVTMSICRRIHSKLFAIVSIVKVTCTHIKSFKWSNWIVIDLYFAARNISVIVLLNI